MITGRGIMLLLLIVFVKPSFSQTIKGKMIDSETNFPLPYVNIGLLNKNIGTVSDSKGLFNFELNDDDSDTVRFSMIGYESIDIPIKDAIPFFKENGIISMKPKTIHLQEVVVRPENYSYKTEGNGKGSKRKKIGFGPNDNLGREIGTVISVKDGKEAYIEESIVNIATNDYGKIKLRINIYEWKNNRPGERINTQPMYFETDQKEGLWKADLKEYNLKVDNDFFISYQYIEDMGDYGLYFTFSFNKAPTLWRESSHSTWNREQYNDKVISIGINTTLAYPH